MYVDYRRQLSLAAFLVLLTVGLALRNPAFASPTNLRDVCVNASHLGIAALGMFLVILIGQIDVSAGSMLAICSTLAGLLAKQGVPTPWVVVAAVLAGTLLGGLNGLIVAGLRIHSSVVTLGTASIYRGLLIKATGGSWIYGLPPAVHGLRPGKHLWRSQSGAHPRHHLPPCGIPVKPVARGARLVCRRLQPGRIRSCGLPVATVQILAANRFEELEVAREVLEREIARRAALMADGEAILDSIAACGATHVEPAFIVGYTEPFEEGAFNEPAAEQYAAWLKQSGLGCFAFSSHVDLGTPEVARTFTRRMDFAARLGAKVINTNAAVRDRAGVFFRNIETLAAHAERLNLVIALENPGNGEDNLFNLAKEGLDLVNRIGSPHVRLNYDAGNTVSHRPGQVDPAQDAVVAMPACAHVHLKDVQIRPEGYFFVPLGEGEVDCATILQALRNREDLNLAIELPLRLHRDPAAQPVRQSSRVALSEIETALCRSLAYVRNQLL